MKSLLSEIAWDLAQITPVQVEHCRSLLTAIEPHERLLVVVEDAEAQRFWALAMEYERQYQLTIHAIRFTPGLLDERDQLTTTASRLSRLSSIVRDMAWVRMQDIARASLGNKPVTNTETFGLRENFSLVSTSSNETDMFHKLKKLLPGKLELMEIIRSSIEAHDDDEEEEKEPSKPKLQ